MKQFHIQILKSFDDLRFNIGKKTLIDFLKGNPNPTIDRNNLDELNSYGSLYMIEKERIENVIEQLLFNNYLEYITIVGGFQVVKRTRKGLKEIFEKKFEPKEKVSVMKNVFDSVTIITDEERKLFDVFDFFLKEFNDEQKKAVISEKKSILCIAGAGSGKTSVLVKRVEFLNKFKNVNEEEILAITFTRKAKEEMLKRLNLLNIIKVRVETFNSFCEKYLKNHEEIAYDMQVRLAQYRDKISIVRNIFSKMSVDFSIFSEGYFNKKQVREKSVDELFFVFVNDIFSVIDFYKNSELEIVPFYELEKNIGKKRIAKLVHDIAKLTHVEMKKRGLRDFSDQIVDVLNMFRKHLEIIPKFKHVLVDEFQDINFIQLELLKFLQPKNIFAVGDPRQAIYGWRGSEVKYILDFPKVFSDSQIIQLKKNYRSKAQIVDFFNLSIEKMGFAALESGRKKDSEKRVFLMEQDSENSEKIFVTEAIKSSNTKRNEIFVLARTNKMLEGFADFFTHHAIKYTIKSEEEYKNGEPKEDEVVLATVHSIKGMEAEDVYLIGANSLSFPNKVQDNFVFALMKNYSDYDKEAEELRLFYVALSRAKERLIISYSGSYTKFITDQMLNIAEFKGKNKTVFDFFKQDNNTTKILDNSNSYVLKNILKDWRNNKSKESNLPLYMILSNKAIEELSIYRPQSKLEMHNISGFGEIKIAKYSDEILRIING